METITTIISFILLISFLLSPVFIILKLNKLYIKRKFIFYLLIGLITTAVIILISAWWVNRSDRMLLAYYGYNIDGMNEVEFYGQVAPENMKRVKQLEFNIMGVGWVLKAIMTFIIYAPLYLLVVYLVNFLIRKIRKKTTPNTH
ncbi:MAG: hypothetical protein KF900_04935 [Bacteroidetes bacterium]|nr:hypothetical protein [Bacteroidota bacterium]